MKYFLDTEFIEGTQSSWFGLNTKPTIDLISIGIVAEDGREYYAISKDFNLKEAWNRYDLEERSKTRTYWIRDNILIPMWVNARKQITNTEFPIPTYKEFKSWINAVGKTNREIAKEVKDFCLELHPISGLPLSSYDTTFNGRLFGDTKYSKNLQFYTYYGAYDWVVFCWLFGRMINLPNGFPMFSIDLKVMLDDKLKSKITAHCRIGNVHFNADKINNGDYSEVLSWVKGRLDYPKQENEHNALDDAKWNKKLYEFIKQL